MKSIYSYLRWDGVRVDLSPLLDNGWSKEEVARVAGVQHRKQRLIAALEAMLKAGEWETVKEVMDVRFRLNQRGSTDLSVILCVFGVGVVASHILIYFASQTFAKLAFVLHTLGL